MVVLLHENRHAASSLLSCHIFVFFAGPFSHINACFYRHLTKVAEYTVVGILGKTTRRNNVKDYV